MIQHDDLQFVIGLRYSRSHSTKDMAQPRRPDLAKWGLPSDRLRARQAFGESTLDSVGHRPGNWAQGSH